MPNPSSSIISDVEEMHIDAPPVSRENDVLNQYSDAISDPKDVHMVDEFEHPLILSGDREIPFTYLASLSAKWAAMKEKAPSVQGKVKVYNFLSFVDVYAYVCGLECLRLCETSLGALSLHIEIALCFLRCEIALNF